MLTNLLPGLRDVRTPLACGYVWLLTLWIFVGTHVPSRLHATGAIATLYTIDSVIGKPGELAALTFVAYLIGTLTELRISRLQPNVARALPWRTANEELLITSGCWDDLLAFSKAKVDGTSFQDNRYKVLPLELPKETWQDMRELIGRILQQLDLLRIRLLLANADLFGEHDRLAAEADLRASVALSSVGLAVALLSHGAAGLGTAVLVASYPVFRSGRGRAKRANDILIQAVISGRISFTDTKDGNSSPTT